MVSSAIPEPDASEQQRLEALARYQILDTATEEQFEDLVALAAQICDTPMALISLVDDRRQWFKARLGIAASETSRDISFCSHAIEQHHVFEVSDATQDQRFADNPLVTGDLNLRFYAGAPLRTPDGQALGTICVLDSQPRAITPDQRQALERLARQVIAQLELRQALRQQREVEQRHRLILDSAIDYGIITMDLHGLVTSWNVGAERLMGWTEAEMCGQLCDDFFTPEDRRNGVPEKEMGSALTVGRGTDERWHLRKDGSRFWGSGEMVPLINDADAPIGFLKIVRDRTAQHQAHEALAESEARTRLALEAGELGAWQADPEIGKMTCDARTCELLGLDPDRPADHATALRAQIHPEDRERVMAIHMADMGAGGAGTMDVEYRTIAGRDGRVRWIHAKGARVKARDGRDRLVGTVRDISAEKEAEAHRQLLTNELEHRVKNTLAVVQSIVSQSLRHVASPLEARDAIGLRLATLGRAHDVLTQANWQEAPMTLIAQEAIRLHGERSDRIRIQGPEVELSAKAALAFSMSLHELATNAAKYGALSKDDGYVELHWTVEDQAGVQKLQLRWQEFNGPPVAPPRRAGFGSRLMAGLANDMGGAGELQYLPGGVIWRLSATLSKIVAQKG